MRIGLIDVDCHASKKKWGATIYPNLALCKISAYHKAKGDDVEWASTFEHYDILYMSKIFNFTEDDGYVYNADKIIKGGTGYDIESQLPPEIDDMQPDLSIYPNLPEDTSYGFLTRGCPNKCKWCVVPKKEGAIRPYWDIDRVANGKKKIVLMDNNILAAGLYGLAQLKKIIDRGYRVDFNQALDARLVNEDNARLLAQIKWIDRIRFGCDTHAQIAECDRAINLINSFGYKGEYFLYTMLNDNFDECLERLMYWWLRARRKRALGEGSYIYPHAQPYRDPTKRNVIPQWQKDMAQWTNNKALFISTNLLQFEPRRGFKFEEYCNEVQQFKYDEVNMIQLIYDYDTPDLPYED